MTERDGRYQIETLVTGNLPPLDDLFQMRARLDEPGRPRVGVQPHRPERATTGTGALHQPTLPRR